MPLPLVTMPAGTVCNPCSEVSSPLTLTMCWCQGIRKQGVMPHPDATGFIKLVAQECRPQEPRFLSHISCAQLKWAAAEVKSTSCKRMGIISNDISTNTTCDTDADPLISAALTLHWHCLRSHQYYPIVYWKVLLCSTTSLSFNVKKRKLQSDISTF